VKILVHQQQNVLLSSFLLDAEMTVTILVVLVVEEG
jgi:hypothetical protein